MLNLVQQNEIWIKKAQEVFDLQQKRKMLEEAEDMARNELKELTGDVDSYGGGFKYESTIRRGSVDYSKIPQLKGVNIDIYRKENVIMWKLSYVGSVLEAENENG